MEVKFSGSRLVSLTRRRAVVGGGTLATSAILTACGAPAQQAPESAPQGAPTVISGTPRAIATSATTGQPTQGGVSPTPRNQTVIIDQTLFQVFDSFNPYIPNGQQTACYLYLSQNSEVTEQSLTSSFMAFVMWKASPRHWVHSMSVTNFVWRATYRTQQSPALCWF